VYIFLAKDLVISKKSITFAGEKQQHQIKTRRNATI
jgi:hypothetical protein